MTWTGYIICRLNLICSLLKRSNSYYSFSPTTQSLGLLWHFRLIWRLNVSQTKRYSGIPACVFPCTLSHADCRHTWPMHHITIRSIRSGQVTNALSYNDRGHGFAPQPRRYLRDLFSRIDTVSGTEGLKMVCVTVRNLLWTAMSVVLTGK